MCQALCLTATGVFTGHRTRPLNGQDLVQSIQYAEDKRRHGNASLILPQASRLVCTFVLEHEGLFTQGDNTHRFVNKVVVLQNMLTGLI